MTVHVGVDPFNGSFSCYAENETTNYNWIAAVKPKENENVASMYKKIISKINVNYGNINLGNICICCDEDYDNKIRKKFIEEGCKSGFMNVQLINSTAGLFFDAVSKTTYEPLDGDIIWISSKNAIYVYEQKARYCNFVYQQKARYRNGLYFNNQLYISDLHNIMEKSPLKKGPSVIIHKNAIDEISFKKLSPACKFFPHKKYGVTDEGCLVKARKTSDEPDFAYLDTKNFLSRHIFLKTGGTVIAEFFPRQELPIYISKKLLKLNESNVIKIISRDKIEETYILPDGKELYLTFQIDTNEIYSVSVEKLPKRNDLSNNHNIVAYSANARQVPRQLPQKNNMTHYKMPKIALPFNSNLIATGIDLGTSRCCAAVNRNSGIQTIALDNTGERLLPSYVAFDEEIPKCGTIVIERLRHFSKSTVYDSKRIIGRSIGEIEIDQFWPFELSNENGFIKLGIQQFNGKGIVSAEEVSGLLLKQIKQKTEEFQGKQLTDAVITVPAAFTEAQNRATLEAAKLAGWKKVTLLPEPIAAAFAYFMDRPIPNKSIVLLFDLGGGTLDVCIFKIENDQIQIISNTGDTKLGGRDFDTILINYFRNALITRYGISMKSSKKYLLMIKCQKIKESLSMLKTASLDIDDFDPAQDGIITITQEEFQKMAEPLLNKIKNTIQSALFQSKLQPDQINKVLQVGGGSRMPMVKGLLKEIFPKAEQCCEEHPDEVVAIGAAYYSATEMSNAVLEKLNIVASANKVKVVSADITTLKVDAIVNAANHNLLGGRDGGVNGVIHAAAGPKLFEECQTLNGCKTGEAKITASYNIKNVKAIIHTVGPRVYVGVTNEIKEKLYNCYKNALIVAIDNDMRTIAFPSISTGSHGYPKDKAAEVATKAVKDFLLKNYEKLNEIIFCVYDKENEDIYKKLIPKVFQ